MKRITILLLGVALGFTASASLSFAQAKTKTKSPVLGSSRARKNGRAHIAGTATTPTRLVRNRKGKLVRVATVHTPPPPSYQLHPDSDRYMEIQKALAERGYFKGEANGQWEDDSVAALRRFQTDFKLPDDGKINALSLSGLGLGPNHNGASANTFPMPFTAATPPATSITSGSAASLPAPDPQVVPASSPPNF